MKLKLIIFWSICPFVLFSQVKISGIVLDQATQEPIVNCVVYTNDKITITDDLGRYIIDAKPTESIFFQQLAYDFFTILSDSLLYNSNVYLTRNVIELREVIILPFHAQKILETAETNLLKRMEQQVIRPYLFHIEGNSNFQAQRETYALVNILLNKVRNGKYRWDMNLTRMDKIKAQNEDDFYYNKHLIKLELFPQKYGFNKGLDEYNCELQDQDDEYFTINIYPKKPGKNRYWYASYTITKQDTVLIGTISQSLTDTTEPSLRNKGKKSLQLLNHFTKINYTSNDETKKYYIRDLLNMYSVKITDNHPQRIITCKGTVSVLDEIPRGSDGQKKIKPYDSVLFEINFPNSPGFWEQYIHK